MSSEDILSAIPSPADLRMPYGSDSNQFGELRLPKGAGPFPLVINIHGGFWRSKYDLTHSGHLCAALTAQGFATWNLEYRRVGNRGGGWPGTIEDISTGYSFIHQHAGVHKLDVKKMVVMGHSAGGQLALCLAAHEPSVTSVISLAGLVDLHRAWELHLSDDAVVEFLGGTPISAPENYKEADPMHLTIGTARQWLIHGSADTMVPADFSRDYVKRKKSEHVNLVEVAGGDHFDVIDPNSRAWDKAAQTVKKSLS